MVGIFARSEVVTYVCNWFKFSYSFFFFFFFLILQLVIDTALPNSAQWQGPYIRRSYSAPYNTEHVQVLRTCYILTTHLYRNIPFSVFNQHYDLILLGSAG